jgi:hypothetical protein
MILAGILIVIAGFLVVVFGWFIWKYKKINLVAGYVKHQIKDPDQYAKDNGIAHIIYGLIVILLGILFMVYENIGFIYIIFPALLVYVYPIYANVKNN